jgi:signal-transduction protein with cAMP-binding, CBS, and nucleotidyltransferase domain
MKTVRRLLQTKQGGIWQTAPDSTVSEATRLMAEKDVGALMVLDGDRLVGIVTERDLARKIAIAGRDPAATTVREIMSERVLYVRPDHTLDECMALMTERHIRHLPVIDAGRIVGMVSIRDVVADLIAEQHFLIEQLESYIFDLPPHSRGQENERARG